MTDIVSSGVILTKKPRKPRCAPTTLATSFRTYGGTFNETDNNENPNGSTAFPYYTYEIGVDEAGRGPLFGRVYTGAVILPAHNPDADTGASGAFDFSLLKDSKKFTSDKKIREVADYIKANVVAWAVSYEEAEVIDRINIRRATLQCMRNSVNTVVKKHRLDIEGTTTPRPKHTDYLLLIDGNDFIPMGTYNQETDEMETYTHVCVEGGDNTYASIAAASILAKVARDDYIEQLCDQYPVLDEMYSLRGNKGYGAKKHLDGIREHGITQWHRRSYGICKEFA